MKRNGLDTKTLERIENKLATLAKRAYTLADELSTAIYHIEKNHKSIVAAHKAHTTMAKRAVMLRNPMYKFAEKIHRKTSVKGGKT